MNRQDPQDYGSAPGRFDFGNVVGNPVALASISIAVLAWFVTLAGTAKAAVDGNSPPNFTLWAIAFSFCCIVGVTIAVAWNTWNRYQIAIVGYLAAALVFTSSAANVLVYQKTAAQEAAGAGHILLSMVMIVWIFYFGRTVDHGYGNSYSLEKDQKRLTHYGGPYGRPDTSTSSHHQPQMYTSTQLGGAFESASPGIGGAGPSNYLSGTTPTASTSVPAPSSSPQPQSSIPDAEIAAPTEYPYRAKAIYSYEANPEDANEISFSKHDVLEVSDVSGRWWQARKTNGDTGIAPSNYLILL